MQLEISLLELSDMYKKHHRLLFPVMLRCIIMKFPVFDHFWCRSRRKNKKSGLLPGHFLRSEKIPNRRNVSLRSEFFAVRPKMPLLYNTISVAASVSTWHIVPEAAAKALQKCSRGRHRETHAPFFAEADSDGSTVPPSVYRRSSRQFSGQRPCCHAMSPCHLPWKAST